MYNYEPSHSFRFDFCKICFLSSGAWCRRWNVEDRCPESTRTGVFKFTSHTTKSIYRRIDIPNRQAEIAEAVPTETVPVWGLGVFWEEVKNKYNINLYLIYQLLWIVRLGTLYMFHLDTFLIFCKAHRLPALWGDCWRSCWNAESGQGGTGERCWVYGWCAVNCHPCFWDA